MVCDMKRLRLLKHWDHGFEFHLIHGYLAAILLSVCCLVHVAALRLADHPSEEFYRLSIRAIGKKDKALPLLN
jgi:hypothetical protein